VQPVTGLQVASVHSMELFCAMGWDLACDFRRGVVLISFALNDGTSALEVSRDLRCDLVSVTWCALEVTVER
jgi:hypothetical protein